MKQAWAWTVKADGTDKQMIAYLKNCEFIDHEKTYTVAEDESNHKFKFTEISSETHAGILEVSEGSEDLIRVDFLPGSVHSWHVPGRSEGVFHFPDITAKITYKGKTGEAFGYCKRYWGDYDGPWGYQFIQGGAADKSKSFWTADATFADFEYNYFKVFDTKTKTLLSAEKIDTWHNNQRAFWRPLIGDRMDVELKEIAKMEFFLTSDRQHSKLVERFGPVELRKGSETVFSGYGFNEICFGTVA